LATPAWSFLWVIPKACHLNEQEIQIIQDLTERLEKCSYGKEELNGQCKKCAQENGAKFPAVMKLLRKVLSGLKVSMHFLLALCFYRLY